MPLSRWLYRLARMERTGEVLASGKPRRIAQRGRNLPLGRLLARVGFWRRVWR